jgi:uncharacterized membrane protein
MIDPNLQPPATEADRPDPHRVDEDGWTGFVLGSAMVAMALVAGLCFTFSVAVMPALADADDRTFVATMQQFNDNPIFQITFTAALVLTVIAAVMQRRHGPEPAVRWTVGALVLYGIVLAVTFGLHVPLNEDIDQAGDPDRAEAAELADVRDDVEDPWVAGNIPRTLLTTAAVAGLGRALLLHGRNTARGRDIR